MPSARIQELLRRTIGLDPASVGPARIDSAVRRRMAATSALEVGVYAARLTVDKSELQELIEAVVVPETFFFREPTAIKALARLMTASTVQSDVGAPLSILSLPCSTGEEPYSIAMALLANGRESGTFRVDGVDISREAIARARRGMYGRSSLRGGHEECMAYLTQLPDGFTIREGVRENVRFGVGNILAPDFALPLEQYDVIFCRNLLIYFDADSQRQVISVLSRILKPDGLLFVGAVDAYPMRSAGFFPVRIDGSYAFRNSRDGNIDGPKLDSRALDYRSDRRNSGFDASSLARVRVSTRAIMRDAEAEAARSLEAADKLASQVVNRSAEPVSFLEVARLADAGQIKDACQLGEQILRATGGDAAAFALLGTIHEAANNADRAEECYRRALYLDPHHEDALLHLAILFERKGETETSARLRARARRASSLGMQ